MKRRLKKRETKRLEKHETGHSVSHSFTIGLISGMSQLDYRYSQFPVTFLYIAQKPAIVAGFFMVGLFGFEPKTSSMSTKRSNQLSYNPMSDGCIIHDMREICKMLFAISCIWLDRCGIHAAARHLIYMDRSFAQRRRRAYLLQIHLSGLPKANKCRSCVSALVRKLFVRGDISEIRHSDIIIQTNTPPCRIL